MMKIKRYEDVSQFWQRVEPYWLQAECLNSLALGIGFRLLAGYYKDVTPLLVTVESEGELVATAVQTPPHHPILYTTHPDVAATMNFLARALAQEPLPGAFGPVETVLAFAQAWQRVTSRPYRLGMKQRLYELRRVEQMPAISGKLRPATPQDFDLLVEWMLGFNQDAFGTKDRDKSVEMTKRHLAEGNFYFWDNGRPVSVAAKTRKSPNGRTVSLVYTPPELRGHGYASACVAALSQHLLQEGYQFCALFTDLANPTSNSIYQRIGYKPIADFNQYRFD